MADAHTIQLARDIDTRCRLRGSFVLRSGHVADEYFDMYLFEADPVLLRRVAEPRKLAEGDDPAGQHVVLVEDVITTGGAVLAAASALRHLGATVTTVVCAIDRSAPGQGVLPAAGVAVRAVLTKADLDAAQQTD
jgi:orotate phosphoribosyltransferase